MPPQGSTHGGTGPTPRQVPGLTVGAGVSGAWPAFETCAQSVGATIKTPTIPSATINANLHRIAEPSFESTGTSDIESLPGRKPYTQHPRGCQAIIHI